MRRVSLSTFPYSVPLFISLYFNDRLSLTISFGLQSCNNDGVGGLFVVGAFRFPRRGHCFNTPADESVLFFHTVSAAKRAQA